MLGFGWLAAAAAVQSVSGFHHAKWTSENGLGAVFDIQQSSDGYLWLTTSKGVVRFDGVRFQSIEEATHGAVRNNEIDSVFVPSTGGLWLTTEGSGLLLWKDGQLTAFPDRRCTPTRKTGRIVEDRDGSLWVQSASGLFHLRGSACEKAGDKEGYPGGFAAGIFMDSGGTLWVKTRIGPLLYLPRGHSKFQPSKFGEGATTSYAFLHEGPDGSIWLSDDQGLRRVESASGKKYKQTSPFSDFTFAPDGSLWVVTAVGVKHFEGVDRWPAPVAEESAPGESFTPSEGLSSDAVWKVLVDREGVVWVATNSGLDRLRRNVLSSPALPPAQEHEFSVAAGDQGSVWTGNSSLPLYPIAEAGGAYHELSRRPPDVVRPAGSQRHDLVGRGRRLPSLAIVRRGLLAAALPRRRADANAVSAASDRNNDPWITARERPRLPVLRRGVERPERSPWQKVGGDRRHGGRSRGKHLVRIFQ